MIGRASWTTVVAIACACGALLFASSAGAAAPEFFAQFPEDGVEGAGAGRLSIPHGVASDPDSGHVFVADGHNARVSEFTAWGEFVKAWGWGVRDGTAAPQTCGPGASPPSATCQIGIEGSGKGQFKFSMGIALDPATHDLYVTDYQDLRVSKFNSAGEFILMFGGGVDKTTGGDVCTEASGDECGAGSSGTATGEFSGWTGGTYIAVAPDGTVLVGDTDRIQEFEPNGVYKGEIGLPAAGEVSGGAPEGKGRPRSLVVDSSGNVYLTLLQQYGTFPSQYPTIFKHTGAGWQVFAEVQHPKELAIDSDQNIYASRQTHISSLDGVVEFAPDGTCLVCEPFGELTQGLAFGPEIGGITTNTGCGVSDLYASYFVDEADLGYVAGFGPTPDTTICPPPAVPPTITDQYAVSVGSDSATLGARINPRFWADTTYFIQYGKSACGPTSCEKDLLAPGVSLGDKAIGKPIATSATAISELEPGTTYHYRFVAQSGGGGPVYGGEKTFTTFPPSSQAQTDCPNQQFRTGAAAFLPNCRAYELVSPVDKNNGSAVLLGDVARVSQLTQSSEDANRFTFTSKWSFAGAPSAPGLNQYVSYRDPGSGWTTEAVSPPRANDVPSGTASGRGQLQFRAFSGDLCQSWLTTNTGPLLGPGAVPGFTNLYKREGCGETEYEPLTTVEPVGQSPGIYAPELQGLAAGDECAILQANGNLSDASSSSPLDLEVYELCGNTLRLVSALPNGTPSSGGASAGTALPSAFRNGRETTLDGAVSPDGSIVYWTASEVTANQLFVRINATKAQSKVGSGLCKEATKACTYKVSALAPTSGLAQFWVGVAEGTRAFFTIGDFEAGKATLYEYDLATKEVSAPIGGKVNGVVGASDDGSRLYFASQEVLSGSEENNGGDQAVAGLPNVYLYERETGETKFVATLSANDVPNNAHLPSPVDPVPFKHTSRVSGDGAHAVFMASSSPTGYDNVDVNSGRPDAEVYLYDAESGDLICPSCNQSGARPAGRQIKPGASGLPGLWASARIQTSETQLYSERVLAEDGTHLFFESFDGLVLRDDNDKQDVYEWEEAASEQGCRELGAELYVPDSNGCISLISSGTGDEDSQFLDASTTGSDVFFATEVSLLPQDPAMIDVYDARVNGGFPSPPPPRETCQGEACQGTTTAPPADSPLASARSGPGNPPPAKRKKCPKGKHRVVKGGKSRCVAKHKHKAKQHRRAER